MTARLAHGDLFGKRRVKLVKRTRNTRVYLEARVVAASVKQIAERDRLDAPMHAKAFVTVYAVCR